MCKHLIHKSYNFFTHVAKYKYSHHYSFRFAPYCTLFWKYRQPRYNTNSALLFVVTRRFVVLAQQNRKLFKANYSLLVVFLLRTFYFVQCKFCAVQNIFVPTITYQLHSLYEIIAHHHSLSSLLIKLNKQMFQVVCPFLSGATPCP